MNTTALYDLGKVMNILNQLELSFDEVDSALLVRGLGVLYALECEDSVQLLQAMVCEHRLNSFKRSGLLKEYTNSALDSLYQIAILCPYIYGQGIIDARVILQKYIEEEIHNECEALYEALNKSNIYSAIDSINNAYQIISNQEISSQEIANDKFEVSPNPSNGTFRIDYNFDPKLQYFFEVKDITGRPVYYQPLFGNTVRLNLPAGIYMGALFDSKGCLGVKKVIIQ